MPASAIERIAAIETRLSIFEEKQDATNAMVQDIHGVMLTRDGTRRGYWKVAAVGGGLAAALGALATFWHDLVEPFLRR